MTKSNEGDYETGYSHEKSDKLSNEDSTGDMRERSQEDFRLGQRGQVKGKDATKNNHYPSKNSKSKKRKKRNWKKGVMILVIASLLITLSFTPLFGDIQNIWGGPVYPEKASFSIQRTFDISTNDDVEYDMELVVPEDIPEQDIQYIQDIQWDGDPYTEIRDGREWKTWSRSLSAYESETIEITYKVETRTIDWGYSSENVGSIEDIPEDVKEMYSGNQWQLDVDRNDDGENDWMIQPDHPAIRSLGEELVEDKDNIYDKSKAIYDWINNNIDYEIGGAGLPKHAAWVLESGTGDCDEQSYLYISLSRSVGIPSWIELGVLYDRMINQWGGHGWVRQIAVDEEGSAGWVNIDPVNHQFFSRGATRITFWTDNATEGNLDEYYHFFSYTRGSDLSIIEDFKNLEMESEGQVVLGNGELIPGFTTITAVPAILISLYVYKKKRDL